MTYVFTNHLMKIFAWVVGLLTGHCRLKGHLFKLGLVKM
jgi:hypothetical protein